MENMDRINSMGLTSAELKNLENYRKKKNTAVLTIMFTDIEGFTALTEEKGETYVHKLHKEHDRILVDIIEKNNTGIVIKYIGDAIMAVFSEPTVAVEKSLSIQKQLKEFNETHPEFDDLKVRIGLHMGQTVIENKMKTDLFGRHVNRASRVESLADGGHIFISYTVFDSVKSWLMDHNGEYKFHGSFFLKGIQKPEEIYEVYNPEMTKPKAPQKGKKPGFNIKPFILTGVAVALIALIGISMLFLVPSFIRSKSADEVLISEIGDKEIEVENPGKESSSVFNREESSQKDTVKKESNSTKNSSPNTTSTPKPVEKVEEVLFMGLAAEKPILDFTTPLAVMVLEGSNDIKKSLNELSPGKHLIHYEAANSVRYFSEFEIKPGKNIIDLKFIRSGLPTVAVYLLLRGNEVNTDSQTNKKKYFFYDKNTLSKIEKIGDVFAETTVERINEDTVKFKTTYSLKIDEKIVFSDSFEIENKIDDEHKFVDAVTIWEDNNHAYSLRYNYINTEIHFFIDSYFK